MELHWITFHELLTTSHLCQATVQLFCDALEVLAKNSMVAFLDLVSAVLEESRSSWTKNTLNPRVFILKDLVQRENLRFLQAHCRSIMHRSLTVCKGQGRHGEQFLYFSATYAHTNFNNPVGLGKKHIQTM